MARKTAIHLTAAEINAADAAADSRRDAAAIEIVPKTSLEILRAARDQMTSGELLKLADSAARLELRGFDPEDRRDCAAEIVWHLMAETGGAPMRRDSQHATLTYACGLAANWRRALKRRRAAEQRAIEAAEDAYALSDAAALDEIGARPEDDAEAAEDAAHAAAMDAASSAVEHLDLPQGGGVWRIFYQWARDLTAEDCAAACGVGLSAWKMSTGRAGELIRAAFPDPGALLEAILPTARPDLHPRKLTPWPTREGTDGGDWPTRPETREDALTACRMRHQCPTPDLERIGRSRARRGYLVRTPSTKLGYFRIPGKGDREIKADALRALARMAAQEARGPERVYYVPTAD